jgi:hypothetical protein
MWAILITEGVIWVIPLTHTHTHTLSTDKFLSTLSSYAVFKVTILLLIQSPFKIEFSLNSFNPQKPHRKFSSYLLPLTGTGLS